MEMTEGEPCEKLTSEELAAHVIDALVVAGVVEGKRAQHAIRIAAEEIEARKVMGDY